MKPKSIPPRTALRPGDGKDELNLAEFPIALLTDRVPDGQKTLEFHDTIRDSRTGQDVVRKLTITAADKYGLPTAKDDEVILGLIQLTKLDGFHDRTVQFSRHQLIHLLRWPDTGPSYRRLDEALFRWLGVTLEYEKAWWDNRAKTWVDEGIHVLDRVSLHDAGRAGRNSLQQALPFSSFTWNEVIFDSFQAGYLKKLNLDFYLSLQSATAKRVYRFLDKRFYHGPRWEFDLAEFAFEHVGLSRGYHTGKIKEKLAPAIHELVALGFLEELPPNERYVQVCRGQWRVVFLKKKETEEVDAPPGPEPLGEQPQRLMAALVERGVTASTAAELVASSSAERIERCVDVFDWLTEKSDKRLSQNPAGYLVKSIRDDYAAPKGYEPKAIRVPKQQAAAQKQKRKQEEQAAQRRQEEQEASARKAQLAHVAGILESLSPEDRQRLEEQAMAHADEKLREAARTADAMGRVARRVLVEREVLRQYPLPSDPK